MKNYLLVYIFSDIRIRYGIILRGRLSDKHIKNMILSSRNSISIYFFLDILDPHDTNIPHYAVDDFMSL